MPNRMSKRSRLGSKDEFFGNLSGQTFLLRRDTAGKLLSEFLVKATVLLKVDPRWEGLEVTVNRQLELRDAEGRV